MVDLRDYQLQAAGAFRIARVRGHRRILLVLPTGCGKTEIFVYIADRWIHGRVLVIAPLIDLVSQAAKKIYKRTGEMPGIEQGELRSEEHPSLRSRFVVGSKQSLTSQRRYRRLEDIGLVVIDEAHLSLTEDYKELIDYFTERGATILAVTATPKRHDGRGLGTLYECCPFNYGVAEAIRDGWLVAPRARCLQLKSLDLSAAKVSRTTGDFVESQLAELMAEQRVVFETAEAVAETCGRDKTLVFCTGVNEAQAVAERLQDSYGLNAEWVCGDTRRCPKDRRREIIASWTGEENGIQIVANVGCLCVGFDFPPLAHIVMARLTRSRALYEQMLGRGTRPLEGVVDFEGSTVESRRAAIAASAKPYFRLTDLRDNAMEHKLVSVVDVLGGKLGLVARSKALGSLGGGAAVDVEEEVLKASEAARLEAEARERAMRAAIDARGSFAEHEVDPLSMAGAASGGNVATRGKGKGPRMPWGKHKGKSVALVPTHYLRWASENMNFRGKWAFMQREIASELAARGERVSA